MKKRTQKDTIKEYIVIGLGRFGNSVARQLEANGCKVLAIDRNERRISQIAEYVTLAMCLDVTNEDALMELGGRNFDGAVISIGHSLDASVLAAIWAKEQGIRQIIAKAYDDMQGKILTKLGVDEIVYPEKEMGVHLANNLAFNNLLDTTELTSDYSMADVGVLKSWVGKSLKELNLRKKYDVNVIAIKRGGALSINPSADDPTQKDDVFVLLGKNNTLKRIADAYISEK
ncbi:MAG: TrkA family potassium uptake protein [Lachnospiraceae bacterium]|jgi:K+ transport systems, NAD-binding component|nr:TrkA family potassium uptake protein [Lachnospiraceae bacterium]MCI9096971.1 TrkA family potassium uptake protein [Lachnospiraceae bacterium]MCI9202948.1 TrkA family potassium uptake protein [Lachnospiraceae bacterium]MCI9334807.1 TrkA family potassium uptake protein [Lachnospiraceae bacterium]